MKTSKSSWLVLLLLQAALVIPAGCFQWQYDATVMGVPFSKVRVEDGIVIGQLREDTVIAGRPCERGWVHLASNGVPIGFTAFREIDFGRFKAPAETWVMQNKDGVVTVCSFPRDTEVQGHLCRGGWGGSEGPQAAFYPDGALKEFFMRQDTRIQGVPCKAGIFSQSISLHENGGLKSCVLSEDYVRDGRTYPKGTHLRLDPDGRIIP
jgi:hypothetical protein